MPDTPTTSLRARKQSLASNSNVWGDPYLNANLDIFDAATTRVATLTTTGGTYTLTNTDYDSTAEAIAAGLYVTGTLGTSLTIVAPARRKITVIRNVTTGGQTVTWGVSGGVQANVRSLSRAMYYTDGTDAFQLTPSFTESGRITGLIDPTTSSDAATKNYVDNVIPAASGFFTYAFSTATGDSDPGTGILKLDNATQSAAIAIYVSTTAGNGGNNASWLDSLALSTQSNNRGQLVIREAQASTDWVIYNITSVSGTGTYRKLNVALNSIPFANPLTNGANVILLYSRTGDGGPIGPTGATGPTGPTGPTGGITGGSLQGAIEELRGPNVLSASTTNIWTTSGNYMQITGSGTILSFGTATQSGGERTIYFAGVNTLTHSAGLLILPNSGANITTVAGATAIVRADDINIARVINYLAPDGSGMQTPLSTLQRGTTSGQVLTAQGTGAAPIYAAIPTAAAGGTPAPQGRLTLVSGAPYMSTDQTAITTVYYTPAVGNQVPIYGGSTFASTTFTEVSVSLDAANFLIGKNYDMFIVSDTGTIRLVYGPAWSSDTARGTGAGTTELQRILGLWTNAVSITGRYSSVGTVAVSANQATYVGTVRASANGQTTFVVSGGGTPATPAYAFVWNAYNKASQLFKVRGGGNSYAGATNRQPYANNINNAFYFVQGLTYANGGSPITGFVTADLTLPASNNVDGSIGLVYGSTASGAFGLDLFAAMGQGSAGTTMNNVPYSTIGTQIGNDNAAYHYPALGYRFWVMFQQSSGATWSYANAFSWFQWEC